MDDCTNPSPGLATVDTAHLLYCAGYWLAGAYYAIGEHSDRGCARAVRRHALASAAVVELCQRGRPCAPRLAAAVETCGLAIVAEWPDAVLRVADHIALRSACGELAWH